MSFVRHLTQDLRIAARSLGRRPGFTSVACLTLAIGIGANTAIFSVINGVLLRPLPYPASEELVAVNITPNRWNAGPGSMSYPDLAEMRDEGASFRSLVVINTSNMTLTGLGDPEVIEVTRVTEGLLETFGAGPASGRDIRRDEFGPRAPTVIVIGHGFWQERLGGVPDVIGQRLVLTGNPYRLEGRESLR
ncbi:MAG: ABC transporter permease, partial [Acidobacteriota bacterium]